MSIRLKRTVTVARLEANRRSALKIDGAAHRGRQAPVEFERAARGRAIKG